jgi:hypothetical protein
MEKMEKPKLTKAYAGYKAACEILNGKTFDEALAVARSNGMHVEGVFEDEKMFDVWAGEYCIVTFRNDKIQPHGLDVWADEKSDEEVGNTDTHIGLIDVGDENYVWQ